MFDKQNQLVGVSGGLIGLGLLALGAGCAPTEEDTERFTQAIPQASEVAVAGPEGVGSESSTEPSRSATGLGGGSGPWAESYALTREVRDGVNHITAEVLGLVWYLVTEVPPNSVDEHEAVWGPYEDALEPDRVRFRVKHLGSEVYEYVLEGQLKSNTGGEYLRVLSGTGYGRDRAEHGNGTFTLDLDAARSLDPFEHRDDSGTISIQHALAGPGYRVRADIRPDTGWAVAESQTLADGTGTLFIEAQEDLEDSETPALEDITLASRWSNTGAGRADYTFTGGDLVDAQWAATECWDPTFARSYFAVGGEKEGSASSCPFDVAAVRQR